MIAGNSLGHVRERAADREFLELPRLPRRELDAFRVNGDFERAVSQEESPAEATARRECQRNRRSIRGREGQQAGCGGRAFRLRDFVVILLRVAQIERLGERAGCLREHLEALAVEMRFRR